MATSDSGSSSFELIDRSEVIADIQAWLEPTDYEAGFSEFHRHLSSLAPGTGQWIIKTSRFQEWHDSEDHGSLWIKGIPGAGKSSIAASMIEHLRNSEGVPVLFFFFRYIIQSNRTPRSLIQDWLVQLLPYSTDLQTQLRTLSTGELGDISDQQLWEYLLTGLSSVEKAYCVVDALDEMQLPAKDKFLQRLNDLATFRPHYVKLIMTSRPKQYLQSALRDTSIVHISLQQDLVGKDIAAFVSHRLSTSLCDKGIQESLTSIICSRSHGLFLYARLLIDQLISSLKSTQNIDMKDLAKKLPLGLEEVYDNVLYQQAKKVDIETSVQVFILKLVTHSSRLLRLNELADALSHVFPNLAKQPKEVVRSACSPLLEILEDETIQVIHHSFTEFLLGSEQAHAFDEIQSRRFPVLISREVHKTLTLTCLSYLQSGILTAQDHQKRDSNDEQSLDYDAASLHHPFLRYAMKNWAYHASHYDIHDGDFFQELTLFLNSSNPHFRIWVSLEWDTNVPIAKVKSPSPLHIAAFAGLTEYGESVLHQVENLDVLDTESRTPLWWAARRNHLGMASLLLDRGAKADADDCGGLKPLHEAAKKNHFTIVRLLLHAGVDLQTPKSRENHSGRIPSGGISTKGETAVEYACRQGHVETIVEMIPFATPETLKQMLCESARYGKPEAVREIFEHSNVSPNARFEGATALHLATYSLSLKSIEILLAKGADADAVSQWLPKDNFRHYPSRMRAIPRKPLNLLAKAWNDKTDTVCCAISKLLIGAGSDLEYVDGDGQTPLLSAFPDQGNPHQVAVAGLLQAGADISAIDEKEKTVLHRLLETTRDVRLVQLLLNFKANIKACDKTGNTILHALFSPPSSQCGPDSLDKVTQFLLEIGAASLCSIKNDFGQSALEYGAKNRQCSLETFRMLLKACPNENIRQKCLWGVCRRKNPEEAKLFIQELMSGGVSLENCDRDGRPVLLSYTRNKDIFQSLLDCGARLEAADSDGRGVLHHFISSFASADRLRALVGLGLDPCKADDNGNTILHEAARCYNGTTRDVQFIRQILEHGVVANATNRLGRTALHVYFEENKVTSTDNETSREHFLNILSKNVQNLDVDAQDDQGVTCLHLAAVRSEINVVKLLSAGADLSVSTNRGETALHLACRSGMSNIVGFLLQQTKKILKNKVNKLGRTSLHVACRSGRPESVYYLLKAGVDIHVQDSKGRTPLHACAEYAVERRLQVLLDHADDEADIEFKDRFKPRVGKIYTMAPWYTNPWTCPPPLAESDTAGVGTILTMLLDAGADVIARDFSEKTPLDLALQYDCREMVKRLQPSLMEVQSCWNILPDNPGLKIAVAVHQKPSRSALSVPEFPLQEFLNDSGRYLPLLDQDDIEYMLTSGVDIMGEKNGFANLSLAHLAAKGGLLEIVDRLGNLVQILDDSDHVRACLKKKPPLIYESCFMPVLQAACDREQPNLQMLELLVEKSGVNVNARALTTTIHQELVPGPTALHQLAKSKYWWQIEGVKYLVQRGALVDTRNHEGETPLHIACGGDSVDLYGKSQGYWTTACVQLLLDLGADPNALDKDHLSPLHKAGSDAEIIKILLARGADLQVGKTNPLFSAIQSRDLQAVTTFLDAGVSANAMDTAETFQVDYTVTNQKRTALFCACFPNRFCGEIETSRSLVKTLLEREADLFAPLNEQETLIHYVFEHAQYAIVKTFLEHAQKINFNITDQIGRTSLLAACNWTECLPGYRHEHWFPKEVGPVIRLLDFGVDVLATDNDGRNALHHLFENPDIEQDTILQFLERESCKPLLSQKTNAGYTPMHFALRNFRPIVCEKLMSMGCDILEPDPTSASALHHIAAQYLQVNEPRRGNRLNQQHPAEYYECACRLWQTFLSLGGDINVRDNRGSPPLFYYLSSPPKDSYRDPSRESCHVHSLTDLFSAATDFYAKNADGETALHVVARRVKTYHTVEGHEARLFESMAGKGLDPLQEDRRGRSSLDVAAAGDKLEILELFQYRS